MQQSLRRLGVLAVALMSLLALAATPASAGKYVALGDSYSTGTGTGGTAIGSGCGRTTNAYPYVLSRQRTDLALTFVACDGAETPDVINTQSSSLTADTGTVTITIGGNDVGFVDLIIGCHTFYCDSAIASTNAKITNELPAKLDATYAKIKSLSPSAQVVVLGYPRQFGSKLCAGVSGISSDEATKLNGVADNLNATIAAAVTRAGGNFTYKSAIQAFTNHDACASIPWVEGFYTGGTAYHPTLEGDRDGYVPLVRAAIG